MLCERASWQVVLHPQIRTRRRPVRTDEPNRTPYTRTHGLGTAPMRSRGVVYANHEREATRVRASVREHQCQNGATEGHMRRCACGGHGAHHFRASTTVCECPRVSASSRALRSQDTSGARVIPG